jgi:hypothetical protein
VYFFPFRQITDGVIVAYPILDDTGRSFFAIGSIIRLETVTFCSTAKYLMPEASSLPKVV